MPEASGIGDGRQKLMLQLSRVYEDAIEAMEAHSRFLGVPSLPATVFMMQRDVINSYRHALDHYFTISLSEPYLQNSSLGAPYQKWAFFVNQNWDMVSFTVHQLLRYTSRLIHETTLNAIRESDQIAGMKPKSNEYSHPLCAFKSRGMKVGVLIAEDQIIQIRPLPTAHESDSPTIRDIRDRSVLIGLRDEGLKELDALTILNRRFGGICNSYSAEPAQEFDNLVESYWT